MLRFHLAALIVVASVVPAAAYKPGRPNIIPLTGEMVRKFVACYPSIERARERATGGMGEVYGRRKQLGDAAAARCGFPRNVVWRNVVYSVRAAHYATADDAPGSEVEAANRDLVAPFKARMERLFASTE